MSAASHHINHLVDAYKLTGWDKDLPFFTLGFFSLSMICLHKNDLKNQFKIVDQKNFNLFI